MARRKKKSFMTASTLTHLPLAAGGAVASGMGRAGLWALARYMRAPLANTGLLALATFTAMAGSNALYNQPMEHPAPMFSPSPRVPEPVLPVAAPAAVIPDPAPAPQRVAEPVVIPTPQPAQQAQPVTGETTGSLAASVPGEPVGNEQVFEVQKKLLELKLFDGKVDGYYGPMTARAIRAFEERNGLEPLGALTPQVVEAILKADAEGRMSAAAVQPQAQVQQAVAVAEQQAETVPAQAAAQPDILIGRVEERVTIESIVDSAAQTIDSIVAELSQGRETPPPQPAVKPVPALPVLQTAEAAPTARQQMPPPVVQTQQVAATPAAPAQAAPEQPIQTASVAPAQTAAPEGPPAANTDLVRQVQRGLASLGFLHGAIDGEANAATARAIRNFEVYHNYEVTGRVTPELVDMLIAAGASV
jgi:peptidoglycan hydrolase-like protein with peptidoglycan-binding domain